MADASGGHDFLCDCSGLILCCQNGKLLIGDNGIQPDMIALGYGCEYMDGTVLTEGFNGFDLYKFRDYARYDAEAYAFEGKKKYRFYEKETGKTVFLY